MALQKANLVDVALDEPQLAVERDQAVGNVALAPVRVRVGEILPVHDRRQLVGPLPRRAVLDPALAAESAGLPVLYLPRRIGVDAIGAAARVVVVRIEPRDRLAPPHRIAGLRV